MVTTFIPVVAIVYSSIDETPFLGNG